MRMELNGLLRGIKEVRPIASDAAEYTLVLSGDNYGYAAFFDVTHPKTPYTPNGEPKPMVTIVCGDGIPPIIERGRKYLMKRKD